MRFLRLVASVFFLSIVALPVQGWAQTVLKNAELLENSGWTRWASATSNNILKAALQAPGGNPTLDASLVKAWRDSARLVYSANKLIQFIDEGLDKEFTANEKRELIAFFNSPLGKRLVELEEAADNAGAEKYLKNTESNGDRMLLYKELNNESTTGATAIVWENVQMLRDGIFWARNGTFDADAIRTRASGQRPALMKKADEQNVAYIAFAYRPLSVEELKANIAFLKTPAAKKFHKALGNWVSAALYSQAKEFEQLLVKKLQGEWPCSKSHPCKNWWGVGGDLADVWKLDIGGVRLHMTAQETIDALKKKFGPGIPVEEKKKNTFSSSWPENVITYITCDSVLVANKKYICKVGYGHSTGQYTIAFEERLPGEDDKRPEVADSINLDPGNFQTNADREQFDLAVVEKYGKPTLDMGGRAEWCIMVASLACNGPNLYYGKTTGYFLRLQEPGYRLKVQSAKESVVKASKPPL